MRCSSTVALHRLWAGRAILQSWLGALRLLCLRFQQYSIRLSTQSEHQILSNAGLQPPREILSINYGSFVTRTSPSLLVRKVRRVQIYWERTVSATKIGLWITTDPVKLSQQEESALSHLSEDKQHWRIDMCRGPKTY